MKGWPGRSRPCGATRGANRRETEFRPQVRSQTEFGNEGLNLAVFSHHFPDEPDFVELSLLVESAKDQTAVPVA